MGRSHRKHPLTVEECVSFSTADLKAWGQLKPECYTRYERVWRRAGQISARLTISVDIDCREQHPCVKIEGTAHGKPICHYALLDAQPMRFGGVRWYFLCPSTGRRCTMLVLVPGRPTFISRSATGLPNMTQRMDWLNRVYAKIEKKENRLKAMSPNTHKSTRSRIISEIIDHQMIVDQVIDAAYQRVKMVDEIFANRHPKKSGDR